MEWLLFGVQYSTRPARLLDGIQSKDQQTSLSSRKYHGQSGRLGSSGIVSGNGKTKNT